MTRRMFRELLGARRLVEKPARSRKSPFLPEQRIWQLLAAIPGSAVWQRRQCRQEGACIPLSLHPLRVAPAHPKHSGTHCLSENGARAAQGRWGVGRQEQEEGRSRAAARGGPAASSRHRRDQGAGVPAGTPVAGSSQALITWFLPLERLPARSPPPDVLRRWRRRS